MAPFLKRRSCKKCEDDLNLIFFKVNTDIHDDNVIKHYVDHEFKSLMKSKVFRKEVGSK